MASGWSRSACSGGRPGYSGTKLSTFLMPDATLDLDEIGRAAGNPEPSLDLDAIGRSASADDVIQREQRKSDLRQQRNLALFEGSRAGALADVIGGVAEPAAQAARNFIPNVLNIPSTIIGSPPLFAPGQSVVHLPFETEDVRQ